ncbi:MAG: helix-turn-helix transcriptional regulator [Gammaproteobacteria bacterium]|nr:helix-turn-helix transcriptional regulator [Gammaproteobacteria bacterium]
MAKLTPFGRRIRKLRVDRDETQSDVARALGVSVAFWSSIETGKKNVPSDLLGRISAHFGLRDPRELEELADVSRNEVRINMQRLNDPSRELVLGFARKFESGSLNEAQLRKLREILGGGD